jgi:hypothetical protein
MADALAVIQGLKVDAGTEPGAENAGAGGGREVMTAAGARMVAMAVGDDGAVHGLPRVDVEIARLAVEAFRAGDDEIHAESLKSLLVRPSASNPVQGLPQAKLFVRSSPDNSFFLAR